MIKQLDATTFETTFRGRVYTLICQPMGGYAMWNKPINGRVCPPKPFNTLQEVENNYRHWKGISQLIKTPLNPQTPGLIYE